MRYSVAPHGRIFPSKGAANIFLFTFTTKLRMAKMELKKYIRDVVDFPNEGIIFKDITPLLNNSEAMQTATDELFNLIPNFKVDKVVGMESRGFFFGPLLAARLNAGFIPVRKPGKLPCEVVSEAYALEYGTDTLEIHADSIKKGDKVLIHDDVLATGGTASAVCKMVERLGGEIVQCNFLIELDFLQGKNQLKAYNIASLLHF